MIRHAFHPALLLTFTIVTAAQADEPTSSTGIGQPVHEILGNSCLDCHNGSGASGGLDLNAATKASIETNTELWEKVVRKLRARQMPPGDVPRPAESMYESALKSLEDSLDRLAAANPRPGRTETFRRLTRFEYQNAIRDLLVLEVDAARLLPQDESSHGFDNVTVGELSPTLLNRYVSAAEKISRLAVGGAGRSPAGDTFRIRPDITQEDHLTELPLGTRGGTQIPYTFPQDGEYEIRVRLARDRNEEVEGLHGRHELEVLLDRKQAAKFIVKPPAGGSQDFSQVDAHLVARVEVTAGPHDVGVTFPQQSNSLLETMRQPYQSRFNMHRHPRSSPAVYQVTITGPYQAEGAGDTPSRRRLFVEQPESADEEEACAKRILAALARRAWRRPVGESDLRNPLKFYQQGRPDGDFDAGIEMALASVLVNPQFLFRIERDPPNVAAGEVYRISDVELASRLSFFLWSSVPDDELLKLAQSGALRQPEVLEKQVRRMLSDDRSRALVTNFAGQWLHLRNLDSVRPDMRLFPDFDDNLRQAMRQETELLVAEVIREDRSVLDLLRSDHTYLNERLARHYEIPHVMGSRFRRVELDEESHRGGILRHGSVLTVTSYATRTSPVIRGQWILKTLLGTPPPPPPDNIPALKENTVDATLSVRQRLAQHRENPQCASCHNLMDPVGFSLENFDAVGRWREMEAGQTVDASGGLPDGSEFDGVDGLEQALLKRPELFAGTLTENLLVYALGRGIDNHDAPAVRRVVKEAAEENYRFSAIIQGIVRSTPFQMRRAE